MARAVLVASAALLLGLLGPAEATHFRYGSIKWEPTAATAADTTLAAALTPTSTWSVNFYVSMAFRRNYFWGAYFNEAWRENRQAVWKSTSAVEEGFNCSTQNPVLVQCFLNTNQRDAYTGAGSTNGGYQLRFPTGMNSAGLPLRPQGGPIVCADPLNKGVAGNPAATGVPSFSGKQATWLTKTDETNPPFDLGSTVEGAGNQISTCTPWNEVFGFFFGDGRDMTTTELVVDVSDVDFADTMAGNTIYVNNNLEPLEHQYTGINTFTAFFTGGNRASELLNNADGRYRLEIEVKMDTRFITNRSPIATNIPILPLPYTDSVSSTSITTGPQSSQHVKFQIAAYDPDCYTEGCDQVRYFLANQNEMGGLLANTVYEMRTINNRLFASPTYTWHQDFYNQLLCDPARGQRRLPAAECDSIVVQDPNNAAQFSPKFPGYQQDTSKQAYQPWSDSVNRPHAPRNLEIDPFSGIVTWKVGKDPFTSSTDGVTQLPSGLYNLVVMVEERHVVDGTAALTNNADRHANPAEQSLGLKVPLDFLLYLYPAMHYCNQDCDSSDTTNIVQTYESKSGKYGDPSESSVPREFVIGDPATGLTGGFTGECNICGGGGVQTTLLGADNTVPIVEIQSTALNNVSYCKVPNIDRNEAAKNCCNPGGGTAEYGLVSDTSFTYPLPAGYDYKGCLGSGPAGAQASQIVPYVGELYACNLNTLPYFLTKETTPLGDTPPLQRPASCAAGKLGNECPLDTTDRNVVAGLFEGMFLPAKVTQSRGKNVEFKLQAYDPDQCVELMIGTTGLYDKMILSDHAYIDERTIERTFRWPATDANGQLTTNDLLDVRPDSVFVCFYASDKYLVTVYPFHCVRIDIIPPSLVKWCDHANVGTMPATVAPPNSKYDVYLDVEFCVPLCVSKSDTAGIEANLDIRKIEYESATWPDATAFPYPYDEVNFPPSGAFKKVGTSNDPLQKNYCFKPEIGEECTYTVCFQGLDADTTTTDPAETLLEVTSVRCVKLEVYNAVMEFDGAEQAVDVEVSQYVVPMNGLTMAAWVHPKCDGLEVERNMTAFYFGSTRNLTTPHNYGGLDTGLEVRNAIVFHEDSKNMGAFFYYDYYIGTVFTEKLFSCGVWHFVAVTIGDDNAAVLYVDGIQPAHQLDNSRDTVKYARVAFSTPSRPDNNMDGDGKGVFKVGHMAPIEPGYGWVGYVDEVAIYNKMLTAEDVQALQYTRLIGGTYAAAAKEDALVGYYTVKGLVSPQVMNFPVNSDSGEATTLVASVGTPSIAKVAVPTITPCVLGMQHSVGPTDGDCVTDVYGWNFAAGFAGACSFGGVQSLATWKTDVIASCTTPGHFSPRFVNVLASNDGASFTDTKKADKTVRHLFMESSLYVDGLGGGAEADSVCKDLPTRAVSFGGWFCPKCGPPVPPAPPPPPPPPSPPPPSPPPPPPSPPPPAGGRV